MKSLLSSFGHAFRGMKKFIQRDRNARIHLASTLMVILFGFYFEISIIDWCLICLAIGLVMAAEALNSSIEILTDLVQPERDEQVRLLKDIAAGGVLIAAIASLAIGLLIFGPKVMGLLNL